MDDAHVQEIADRYVPRDESVGDNRLPVLATEINKAIREEKAQDHKADDYANRSEAARKAAMEWRLKIGAYLIEAKALVDHGQWLPWLRDNCALQERVAQNYMRLAAKRDEIAANTNPDSDLTMAAALNAVAKPKEPAKPRAEPPPSTAQHPKIPVTVGEQEPNGWQADPFPAQRSIMGGPGWIDLAANIAVDWFERQVIAGRIAPATVDMIASCLKAISIAYARPKSMEARPRKRQQLSYDEKQSNFAWAKEQDRLERQSLVTDQVQLALDETVLPAYIKEMKDARQVINSRKGVFPRDTYRQILSCLHPDRVTDPGEKEKYAAAFRAFSDAELALCRDKEPPPRITDVPKTYAEWMARRKTKTV